MHALNWIRLFLVLILLVAAVPARLCAEGPYKRFFTGLESGPLTWTGLAIANTGPDPATFVIRVRDTSGTVRTTTQVGIAAGAQQAMLVNPGFEGVASLAVETVASPEFSCLVIQGEGGLAREVHPAAGHMRSVLPHVAVDAVWDSFLSLTNTCGLEVPVTVVLRDAQGAQAARRTLFLPGFGSTRLDVREDLTVSEIGSGTVLVESPGPVAAGLVYNNFRAGGDSSVGTTARLLSPDVVPGPGVVFLDRGLGLVLDGAAEEEMFLSLPYGFQAYDPSGVLLLESSDQASSCSVASQPGVVVRDTCGRDRHIVFLTDTPPAFVHPGEDMQSFPTYIDSRRVRLEAVEGDPFQRVGRIDILDRSGARVGSSEGGAGFFPATGLAVGETRSYTARAYSVGGPEDKPIGFVATTFQVVRTTYSG